MTYIVAETDRHIPDSDQNEDTWLRHPIMKQAMAEAMAVAAATSAAGIPACESICGLTSRV